MIKRALLPIVLGVALFLGSCLTQGCASGQSTVRVESFGGTGYVNLDVAYLGHVSVELDNQVLTRVVGEENELVYCPVLELRIGTTHMMGTLPPMTDSGGEPLLDPLCLETFGPVRPIAVMTDATGPQESPGPD